jgi:hypothetical protein
MPATENDPHAIIGKICHIISLSPTGPRADASKSVPYLNSYDNLILFCATHHDEVDLQENTFTVETLQQWKADHEKQALMRIQQAMLGVGFHELEIVCRGILGSAGQPSDPTIPTPPIKKMEKNGLTERLRFKMSIGLSKFPEVENYVSGISRLDPPFPERLKAGFIKSYNEFLEQDFKGDSLFEAMVEFANGGSGNFDRKAAGLAVLCYLFHKCEVFEP